MYKQWKIFGFFTLEREPHGCETYHFCFLSLCSQIKNYLLTWWEKYNAYSKKSLAYGNTMLIL